ncbi:MAG: dihydroneopterin aldolase family protein [Candidatus Caldarchaeum sp.]|nr:dihydroneopterin aldolase family protein [Candidatus Caldarchaeum sp.]MCX8201564.1 dihydroneopterin aldolase family protein [Candidatus Caldarchaeum sp.]MDW8062858.1 dihydroneopterin aldolase family protein [Candidatus Caldarchaeum sp.]
MDFDPAKKYFPPNFSDRERAIFEAGIALGSLFHSIVGLPASAETRKFLEKAMAKSFRLQPFRRKVEVNLRNLPKKRGEYRYGSVSATNLNASVEIRYGDASVTASVKYIPSLNYPLMYVSKVVERKASSSSGPSARIRRKGARRTV